MQAKEEMMSLPLLSEYRWDFQKQHNKNNKFQLKKTEKRDQWTNMAPPKSSESVVHEMCFVLGPKEIMDDRMCPGV